MELKERIEQILDGIDPSWYPRLVEVLAETQPEIFEQVFIETISRNAAKNVARYVDPPCCEVCGRSVFRLPGGGWRHTYDLPDTQHEVTGVKGEATYDYGNSGMH